MITRLAWSWLALQNLHAKWATLLGWLTGKNNLLCLRRKTVACSSLPLNLLFVDVMFVGWLALSTWTNLLKTLLNCS
jgi:hypothetical protein